MGSGGQSVVGRLVCDEKTAKHLADILSEGLSDALDGRETAVAAFEGLDGRWNVEIHFEAVPDQATVRRLVAEAAGGGLRVDFETIAARDWVAASLSELKPV